MSTKLVKTQTKGLDALKQNYTEEQNAEALATMRVEPTYCPLNGMIAERFAGQAKQILDYGFTELTHLRRGQAHKIITVLVGGASWDKSVTAICSQLEIQRESLYDIEKKWPYMYHFVNLLILELIIPVSFGRVLHATQDAAIHGSDRDRRLYYELFAGLRQKNDKQGDQNFIFVQDSMARPEVINVTPDTEPDE